MSGEAKPLPEWATQTCADCGLPLWDGSMWKSDTRKLTHIGDCEDAAKAMADLPTEYALLHQHMIEAQEFVGRFISEATDEEWADPKRLHNALVGLSALLSENRRLRNYEREASA